MTNKPDHAQMVQRARTMRRNPTPAEYELWQRLRQRQLDGFKFTRQAVVDNRIVDFCCREERFVIELDGGHHGEQIERDEMRSMQLTALGYRVVRFWNNDVLENVEGVLEKIREALLAPHRDPHLNPLPGRERTSHDPADLPDGSSSRAHHGGLK